MTNRSQPSAVKNDNERAIALEILLEVLERGGFSHIVIRMALDKYSYLSKSERAFIARLSRGVIERKLELDAVIDTVSTVKTAKMKPVIRNILRMTAYQLKYMNVAAHAVCSEAVSLAVRKGFAPLKGFVNAVSRRLAEKADSIDFSGNPLLKYSIDEWLWKRLNDWYPKEKVVAYLEASLKQDGHPVTVHFHCKELSSDKIIDSLQKEGVIVTKAPYANDCYNLESTGDVRQLDMFKKGFIQVQDVSSCLAAQALAPEDESFCIDMCSAPGGKSIYIAKHMHGTGRVLARDISPSKLGLIEENRQRCHADNIWLELWDASKYDSKNAGCADYVLADVPCSGLGIIDKKPEIKYRTCAEKLDELTALQRQILKAAAELLKPGGVLVYSTCTINPEENIENVRWLTSRGDFEIEDLSPFISANIEENDLKKGYIQLIPGTNSCDGFFVARLRKKQ